MSDLPKEWSAKTRHDWHTKVLFQRFKRHTNHEVHYFCLYNGGPIRRRHMRRDWLEMKTRTMETINDGVVTVFQSFV